MEIPLGTVGGEAPRLASWTRRGEIFGILHSCSIGYLKFEHDAPSLFKERDEKAVPSTKMAL